MFNKWFLRPIAYCMPSILGSSSAYYSIYFFNELFKFLYKESDHNETIDYIKGHADIVIILISYELTKKIISNLINKCIDRKKIEKNSDHSTIQADSFDYVGDDYFMYKRLCDQDNAYDIPLSESATRLP